MVKMAKGQWSATPVTILGAVVALIAIGAGFVVAMALGDGINDKTTPLILTILGIVGTAVPAILALLKVEHIQSDIRNGVITEKARQGANLALQETGVAALPTVAEGLGLVELDGPTIREALIKSLVNEQMKRKDSDNER